MEDIVLPKLDLALLASFFDSSKENPCIGTTHVCIYAALLKFLHERGERNRISVFSNEVMKLARIASVTTYFKTMRELEAYGYIKYIPSYNHFLGSQVHFIGR